MRIQCFRLALVCQLLAVGSALGGEAPVAVSPGDVSHVVLTADRCPTFSWGAVEGATAYELLVYRVGDEGEQAAPVLRQGFAGSVSSWTPPLHLCFDRGGRYAWTVRAAAKQGVSRWSSPRLFEVAPGPSEAELEAAVELVRRYLAAGGKEAQASEAAVVASAAQGSGSVAPSSAPATRAVPGATELSVEGNIDATSFTGDGTNLAGVATQAELGGHAFVSDAHHGPPSTLPPSGAAGGDLAGTYPNPTVGANAVGSAEITDGSVAEADLAFDPATQAELGGHAFVSDAHHGPPSTLPPSGAAGGDLAGTYPNPTVGADAVGSAEITDGSVAEADLAFDPATQAELEALGVTGECEGFAVSGRRYVDRGDGTVRDCNTGKIWLKDAGCLGVDTWSDSATKVASLNSGTDFGCSGYTAGTYTDWAVPAMTDLCGLWNGSCSGMSCCSASQGIVDTSVTGTKAVANGKGDAGWTPGNVFVGLWSKYWSNTEFATDTSKAWFANLLNGNININAKTGLLYVLPVRSGT